MGDKKYIDGKELIRNLNGCNAFKDDEDIYIPVKALTIAIEQSLVSEPLVRFPCRFGDVVYVIEDGAVQKETVLGVTLSDLDKVTIETEKHIELGLGTDCFLSEELAKEAANEKA